MQLVTDRLRKFLESNAAYDSAVRNILDQTSINDIGKWYISDHISDLFVWEDSQEGHDYWDSLDMKYFKSITKKEDALWN